MSHIMKQAINALQVMDRYRKEVKEMQHFTSFFQKLNLRFVQFLLL